MPIKIHDNLPAKEILRAENIFVMDESRAFHQDIRPLKIAILNLMPTKQITEVQLLRLIGNTPLQIEVCLLHMESHVSKNTSPAYLATFYNVFNDIQDQKFDGLVITGAPVEMMNYEDVTYWNELLQVLKWADTNVTSSLYICWAAQAGLYHHYGIPKHTLPKKMFGVFPHTKSMPNKNILRGFDDVFYAPHSRYTEVRRSDIEKIADLDILSESEEAGLYLLASNDGSRVFVTGHSEYDPETLKNEYLRDIGRGIDTELPRHYFKDDDPAKPPLVTWRSHASLLFANWLNYYVYQETPYVLGDIL